MSNPLVKEEEKEHTIHPVREEEDYRDYETVRTKKVKKEEEKVVIPPSVQVKQENVESKQEEIAQPDWGYWQYTDEYTKEGNTFTKAGSDFLKMVRSKQPLPNQGVISFLFKPQSLTTFSFGIFTSNRKDYTHISQGKEGAIFLTSFSNGNALVNVDTTVNHKNLRTQLHMGAGTSMRVKIDMKKRELVFIKAGLILREPFTPCFLGRQIYPFFQVKSVNARFEISKLQ